MIKREIYEIKGFDFALGCVLNLVCGYEFGKTLAERMQGLVDFENPETRNYKKFKIKRWKGKIKGSDYARISICEAESYLARVSLFYEDEKQDGVAEIKAVLRGIRIGKKNLEQCTKKIEEPTTEPIKRFENLPANAIYSSD